MLEGVQPSDAAAELGEHIDHNAFEPAFTSDFKSKHGAEETYGRARSLVARDLPPAAAADQR